MGKYCFRKCAAEDANYPQRYSTVICGRPGCPAGSSMQPLTQTILSLVTAGLLDIAMLAFFGSQTAVSLCLGCPDGKYRIDNYSLGSNSTLGEPSKVFGWARLETERTVGRRVLEGKLSVWADIVCLLQKLWVWNEVQGIFRRSGFRFEFPKSYCRYSTLISLQTSWQSGVSKPCFVDCFGVCSGHTCLSSVSAVHSRICLCGHVWHAHYGWPPGHDRSWVPCLGLSLLHLTTFWCLPFSSAMLQQAAGRLSFPWFATAGGNLSMSSGASKFPTLTSGPPNTRGSLLTSSFTFPALERV